MSGLLSADHSGYSTPLTAPQTPGLLEDHNGIFFTPRRAMMSFENLVALANHQERLKEARKMVWRNRGEPVVELNSLEECLRHALLGGFRSGTLAFTIRACVNIVLALIRMHRVPREQRLALIRHAIFGSSTFQFAAMLGSFTSLYKFLINALPILIPAMNPRQTTSSRSASALDDEDTDLLTLHVPDASAISGSRRKERLSLSKRAQELLVRKQTRRWHAALAGGIAGGLAIMWEARSRRAVISQQMFVRGLQGSYNAYTTKRNIKVPHGDVLVFSLACAQILYGFLLRPETLPRSYNTWIQQASKVPPECVRMNNSLVRNGTFNVDDLDRITKLKEITSANRTDLFDLRTAFLQPSKDGSDYFPRYAPCSAVHPALSACTAVPLDRFFSVFKWMLPIYGALHFVPAVVFRRKAFTQDPGKVLVKAGVGSLRSSAFLGVFVVIYQTLFCSKHNLHEYLSLLRKGRFPSSILANTLLAQIPQWIIDLLVSKGSFAALGLASGLSLFVEEKRRRGELAMYVLPKGLESAWVMARGKGWVFRTGKWGETILTSLGMAMVMSTYQNDPQHLSGLVRRMLYQFIGPN
ncbi:hypothetical protein CPB83DRAFT_765090 [Crepidotus variabilis]|uniref:Transmembrane protein 135 N-terminal domain-containing protein n=1 Tax=Crepidotus variabilis TaxID=179855 RepID=A0A9P6EI95_9AGAR|nr:hypothetical protein CPB83DRAFT_765090 [Crepidotus variabilis]